MGGTIKTYVLYHDSCQDGFAAAWSYYKKYGNGAIYIAVMHHQPPPDMVPGSQVFISDFSYSREIMLRLKLQHQKVFLIDHHKSAQEDLGDLDFVHFDMSKSGAVLTYENLFQGMKIPLFLEYIQDKDLWAFTLPHSKILNSLISSVKFSFDNYDNLSREFENNFEAMLDRARYINESNERHIESVCHQAKLVHFDNYEIPCVNSVLLQSEVCNELLQRYPNSPFAMSFFFDKSSRIKCSLRSRGSFDVSLLAAKYGGGGHKSAAGCMLTLEQLTWL